MAMKRCVHVVGVGRSPFTAAEPDASAAVLGGQGARAALMDASLQGQFVQRAFIASVGRHGEEWANAACCAARMAGIPDFKVSTSLDGGAHALSLARDAVAKGSIDCALVLGVHADVTQHSKSADEHAMAAARAACAYISRHGARKETFARIAMKARQHAARNPLALEHRAMGWSEVMTLEVLAEPLTGMHCSLPRAGSAAVVLCSADFACRHQLDKRVFIAAQGLDRSSSCDDVPRASECAAQKAYAEAGAGPEHLDFVELHDDFTSSEFLAYEALRLAPEGTAERFVLEGGNTYGGLVVTNPSGGMLGLGNAGAANALAQCAEVVWQLRGSAGQRQVHGARAAMQHSVDQETGTCVVTLYRAERR
jgi:acetyl-CoA acetyltransferase